MIVDDEVESFMRKSNPNDNNVFVLNNLASITKYADLKQVKIKIF